MDKGEEDEASLFLRMAKISLVIEIKVFLSSKLIEMRVLESLREKRVVVS